MKKVLLIILSCMYLFVPEAYAQVKGRQTKKKLKKYIAFQNAQIDSLVRNTYSLTDTIIEEMKFNQKLEDSIEIINNIYTHLEQNMIELRGSIMNLKTDLQVKEQINTQLTRELVRKDDSISHLLFKIDSLLSLKNFQPIYIPYLKANGKYIFLEKQNLNPLNGEEFDYAEPFNIYGLATVGKNEKLGIINKQGTIVLPIRYDHISAFKNHRAAVIIDSKNEMLSTEVFYKYIDTTGKFTSNKTYSYWSDPQCDSDDLDYFLSDRTFNKISKGRKYGLLGSNFAELIPCIYDELYILNNYIFAYKSNLCTIYDTTGRSLISSVYEIDGWKYSENLCPATKSNKWGFLGIGGSWSLNPEFDEVGVFSEGLAPIKKSGKWGYINKEGKTMIPFEYSDAREFSEGLASVKKSGKWGYINKEGKTMIPFEYSDFPAYDGDDISNMHSDNFNKGLASVCQNNKFGLINKNGSIVIPIIFDFISVNENGLLITRLNDQYGFIDAGGDIMCNPMYEDLRFFSEGLAAAKKNGFWGFIDKDNKVVAPFIYEYVEDFNNSYSHVTKDGRSFYIDKQGIELIQ